MKITSAKTCRKPIRENSASQKFGAIWYFINALYKSSLVKVLKLLLGEMQSPCCFRVPHVTYHKNQGTILAQYYDIMKHHKVCN